VVAAASLLGATQATFGLCYGLPIARFGENGLQRALPGKVPAFAFYSPGWHTEAYIRESNHFAYFTPTWTSFESFQRYLLSIAMLAIPLAAVHLSACLVSVRLLFRGEDAMTPSSLETSSEAIARPSLARRSSAAIFVSVTCWIVLMCLWGGVDRGVLTQGRVGGVVTEVAYGPFGRFSLLVAAGCVYLLVLALFIRCLYRWGTRQPRTAGTAVVGRGTVCFLAVCSVMFATFPYWVKQSRRIVGDELATSIEQWSRRTPLRSVLDALSPIPQSKCAPLAEDED